MALSIQIPNQVARQGVAFSYTFPENTFQPFAGLTYRAFKNRLLREENLPAWLSFNPATRTFSGTPLHWRDCKPTQICVEADDGVTTFTCIFILHVSQPAQLGSKPWRAGDVPNVYLTLDNIATFNPDVVVPGGFYAIGTDITRNALTSSYQDKITAIRGNGGLPLWIFDNVNGLKAHQVNYFCGNDFSKIFPGETLACNFDNGDIRALNPQGQLMGEEGKHIYVTNYNLPGFIRGRNWQDYQNVSSIRFQRNNSGRQDRYVTVFGQPGGPNRNVPLVNLYGVGLREGILFQVDGPEGHIGQHYTQMPEGTIGCHWKPNTTLTGGDRRPSENVNGWNMNSHHLWITDNFATDITHEVIYLGGGGWPGGPIKAYHYEADGVTKKKVLHNGVLVDDYHNIQRFNSTHEYVTIDDNIFLRTGWDPIQTRCVIREHYISGNYCFESARGSDVNTVQAEGIITDCVGEIYNNWVEKAWFAGIRCNSIGMMAIHHNIIIEGGQDNYGNPNLSGAPKFGTAILGSARGFVTDNVPQEYIQQYENYDPLKTYGFDNFQQRNRVKKNGKSFRSLQPNNTGHDPETSPTWWEDTREWVDAIMRTDVTEADDFFKLYHNTLVNNVTNTIEIGITTPPAKRFIKNNLAVNSGSNVISGGVGSDTENNIAVTGAALSTYFLDPANQDFRPKVGSPAIGAGVDLTAEINGEGVFSEGFKDYSGMVHANPPTVGAFENGSPVGDHYSFAINGQSPGVSNPPPITLNAGDDKEFILPLPNGIVLTAIKSDNARVLTSILWEQVSGPPANIANANTLSATITNLQAADNYTFKITTVDEFDQVSTDEVNVVIKAMATYSSFRWYSAPNIGAPAGTPGTPDEDNMTLIQGANEIDYTPTPGLNLWYMGVEIPISKTGTLVAGEQKTTWVYVA